MKKLLAAAAIVCIGFASSITTAAPANADSRRWPLCLDDPRLLNISPSPITETQLKQQGAKITVNAKGLRPNTLGVALVIKGKLQTTDDLLEKAREEAGGELSASRLEEFKALKAMNISHANPNNYIFDDIDPNNTGVIARTGYVVSDENGTVSFTFGGAEEAKEKSPLSAEQEELVNELNTTPWSSQLPESKDDDYRGDYTVLLALPRSGPYDLYQLAFDENNSLVPIPPNRLHSDKYKPIIDSREAMLREQGVSEDRSRSYAEFIPILGCTGFTVTDNPPETPEPEETPTPEPSPTPSESSTPEPSPTPSESSTPSETPTPEPSESSTPTPAPEPTESTPPTPGDSSPSTMPRTGAQIMGALAAAGTLLAVGTAITVLSRRRSQRQ